MEMDRFKAEVRNQRVHLQYYLSEYPRNGITKSMIYAEYHILEGMVYAWLYLTGEWSHQGRITILKDLNDILMINLSVDMRKYRNTIEEVMAKGREW